MPYGSNRQRSRYIRQPCIRCGRVTTKQKRPKTESARHQITGFVKLPRVEELAALRRNCARHV